MGTHLTLVFEPPGPFVNKWAAPPVSSSQPSVVSVTTTTVTGSELSAHLQVNAPGASQIQATVTFRECTESDPTPCDAGAPTTSAPPPPPPLTVTVTVPAPS